MNNEILARDVMRSEVISLQPTHSLLEALKILEEFNISGAPVLSENSELLGLVTFKDIIESLLDTQQSSTPTGGFLGEDPDWWALMIRDRIEELDSILVEEVMTTNVISEETDEPVSSLAATMRHRRIHRIVITEDRKVVGIVTTFDLLGILERH